MRHPAEGTLRRLVDDPSGVADADREHVASCPECLDGLAAAQRDAALVASALDTGAGTGRGTDAAWTRLSVAVAGGDALSGAGAPRPSRWRSLMRSPAVAVVTVVALLSGAGVAAARDWLPIFRTERVAPIRLTEADLVALPDLAAYGTVQVVSEPDVVPVEDAGTAREVSGLAPPRVRDLPRGVTGEPRYLVGGPAEVVFTFSTESARSAAAAAGMPLPPPPPGLDGAAFRLRAGPGVATVWTQRDGVPALVVARAVAPTASSSGVPFETARDYLLSLPGLPPRVASQLRQFAADGTTLPLPVPAELVETAGAFVNGVRATVLTSRDGVFAGVVWVERGVVHGVAGTISSGEAVAVARELDR